MKDKSSAVLPDLREISAFFDVRADFVHGMPYGSGHINDTYCASLDQAGLLPFRYIIQRINTNVFKTPVQLLENIARVTRHSHLKWKKWWLLTLVEASISYENHHHVRRSKNAWRLHTLYKLK